MSFTATQTVINLTQNSSYVGISQSYDITPKIAYESKNLTGNLANRIATLYTALERTAAIQWGRKLSDEQIATIFKKRRDTITPLEYTTQYANMNNKVPFEEISRNRQECSFFERFTPTMITITSWTVAQSTSQTIQTASALLNISFYVGSDFISDIIPTLHITPPSISYPNPYPKEDVPYVRMVRDPLAYILQDVSFTSKGSENKLYQDTGLSYLTSLELRSKDKYHLAQKILGNEELKYASAGCNLFGNDSQDRYDRKTVYTDGNQTAQPIYDSLFYKENGMTSSDTLMNSGDPIMQTMPMPLLSTFSHDKQSLQTAFLGNSTQLSLDVRLRNLDKMFVQVGRGKSYDSTRPSGVAMQYERPLNAQVSMSLSYRYGLLPSYLQAILSYSSSINIYTINRHNTAPLNNRRVPLATKTPIAYITAFGLLNSIGLNKLNNNERADLWSSMVMNRKNEISAGTTSKTVNLTGLQLFAEGSELLLVDTNGTTHYDGPKILAGTPITLTDSSGLTQTISLTLTLDENTPLSSTVPSNPGDITANSAVLNNTAVVLSNYQTGTVSPSFTVSFDEVVPIKSVAWRQDDILAEQSIDYSGQQVKIIEAVDNNTLDARALNTKSHSAPHRRGMYVHSFCTDTPEVNKETGYILPVIGTETTYICEPSSAVQAHNLISDYDIHVIVGSRNIIQSQAGMIHPKFVG